eukprot:SAG31_NODE_2493_length_5611_cov_8.195755_6_plen_422_part_00
MGNLSLHGCGDSGCGYDDEAAPPALVKLAASRRPPARDHARDHAVSTCSGFCSGASQATQSEIISDLPGTPLRRQLTGQVVFGAQIQHSAAGAMDSGDAASRPGHYYRSNITPISHHRIGQGVGRASRSSATIRRRYLTGAARCSSQIHSTSSAHGSGVAAPTSLHESRLAVTSALAKLQSLEKRTADRCKQLRTVLARSTGLQTGGHWDESSAESVQRLLAEVEHACQLASLADLPSLEELMQANVESVTRLDQDAAVLEELMQANVESVTRLDQDAAVLGNRHCKHVLGRTVDPPLDISTGSPIETPPMLDDWATVGCSAGNTTDTVPAGSRTTDCTSSAGSDTQSLCIMASSSTPCPDDSVDVNESVTPHDHDNAPDRMKVEEQKPTKKGLKNAERTARPARLAIRTHSDLNRLPAPS